MTTAPVRSTFRNGGVRYGDKPFPLYTSFTLEGDCPLCPWAPCTPGVPSPQGFLFSPRDCISSLDFRGDAPLPLTRASSPFIKSPLYDTFVKLVSSFNNPCFSSGEIPSGCDDRFNLSLRLALDVKLELAAGFAFAGFALENRAGVSTAIRGFVFELG